MGFLWRGGPTYRYGNYAGPGWTGGQEVRPNERGDFRVIPASPTDALARAHDWAYANADVARDKGDDKSADAIIWDADRALREGIAERRQFLQDQWKTMNRDEWTRKYQDKNFATRDIGIAFTLKRTNRFDRPSGVNEDAVRGYNIPLPALPGTTPDPTPEKPEPEEGKEPEEPPKTEPPTDKSVDPDTGAEPAPYSPPRPVLKRKKNRKPNTPKPGSGGGGDGGGAAGGTGNGGAGAGTAAVVPMRRDPLVLDLDGDGVETTSPRDGTVILFDHDADGVKTGTGWVKPDDGWLVLDRNGNGVIDSGRELFGVDTIKRNGQFALDGFDALSDFDLNQDGKIDANDSVFANLRIWRDLNQDGVSQENELSTLIANGIVSIDVHSIATRKDLGNGNIQSATGSFLRANGVIGSTGETSANVGNLDLLTNTFYREFATHITLTEQAQHLPELTGSGRVRDLREAISLSSELGDWVETYLQQSTRQSQIERLDSFIEKWANTADIGSLKMQADALASHGVSLTYNLAGLSLGTADYNEFIRKLGVVERFMGFSFGGTSGQARLTPLDASSGHVNVSLDANQIQNVILAYERFKTDIYESLLPDSRLKIYSDLLPNGNDHGEIAALENAFKQAIALNAHSGIVDLVEFISAIGETNLSIYGWDALSFLNSQISASPELAKFAEELSSWTVRFNGNGIAFNPTLERNDIIIGNQNRDEIYSGSGDDRIFGGAGSDWLGGQNGDDFLSGDDGNDELLGEDGNDTLNGGAGNDYLRGGSGADIYLFGRGAGVDTIMNGDADLLWVNADKVLLGAGIAPIDLSLKRSNDDLVIKIKGTNDVLTIASYFVGSAKTSSAVEYIEFADGTGWTIAQVKQIVLIATTGDDDFVGYDSDDQILGGVGNDRLRGMDGNDILSGGSGNDYLFGENGDDTLFGGIGNDGLSGGAGSDDLKGGDGDDSLSGNEGDDILVGGNGDDQLNGGSGNDIYQWGRDSGKDTIFNQDATLGRKDIIQIGAGVLPSDILVVNTKLHHDAVLKIKGTTDTLTIKGGFSTLNNEAV